MGCGCLGPLFGGGRTRRVQSEEQGHGSTTDRPWVGDPLSAIEEEPSSSTQEPSSASEPRGKPSEVGREREQKSRGGEGVGAELGAGGVKTPGANLSLGYSPSGKGLFTQGASGGGEEECSLRSVSTKESSWDTAGAQLKGDALGPDSNDSSLERPENKSASADEPAGGEEYPSSIQSTFSQVRRPSGSFSSMLDEAGVGVGEGEERAAAVSADKAAPDAPHGELNVASPGGELLVEPPVAISLPLIGELNSGQNLLAEQDLGKQGQGQPLQKQADVTENKAEHANVPCGSSSNIQSLVRVSRSPHSSELKAHFPPTDQLSCSTVAPVEHFPQAPPEEQLNAPSNSEKTRQLLESSSSRTLGADLIQTEKDGNRDVVWHNSSMAQNSAAKALLEESSQQAGGKAPATAASTGKNRASSLQQAFQVADLGFRMDPVRKGRPKDAEGGQIALKRGPSALEQLSLLQLDINEDLLSDLSPRADSVLTPDSSMNGTPFPQKQTESMWETFKSERPEKEPADGGNDGRQKGSDLEGEGLAADTKTSKPSPVGTGERFQGVVSPVQAALRLIKRSQKLSSPTKRRVRGPVEGPGGEKSVQDSGGGLESSDTEKSLGSRSPPVKRKVNSIRSTSAHLDSDDSASSIENIRKLGSMKSRRVVDKSRAIEGADELGSSKVWSPVKGLSSQASQSSTVGESSSAESADESITSKARAIRKGAKPKVGSVRQRTETRRPQAAAQLSGVSSTDNPSVAQMKAASDIKDSPDLRAPAVDSGEKRVGRNAPRRATGPAAAPDVVTSPPRVGKEERQLPPSEVALVKESVSDGATGKARLSEALQKQKAHAQKGAHMGGDAATRPSGALSSGVSTGHWRTVAAGLQQPTLSWREKLSQLEESVHLFSDHGLVSDSSRTSSWGERPLEPPRPMHPPEKKQGDEKKGKGMGGFAPSGAGMVSPQQQGRENGGRGLVTGQNSQGGRITGPSPGGSLPTAKKVGRSTTTPSKRGAWKEEKPRELQKGGGLPREDGGVGRSVSEPRVIRATSAPRERRERPAASAAQGQNPDLESKQLWLAAEEKRIKDEAVRLASLAASLERETERLERQRLQAEKLEREMRERFSVLDNRTVRQSPRSEELPAATDRWVVDPPAGRVSKRRGTKEDTTSPSSDARPLSLPRARSQPGSRAPSRPRSRSSKKGEERASRSTKGEDSSSSSGTRSNRSARAVRRKKYERSRSTGRLRAERNALGDTWRFSGDEKRSGVEQRGRGIERPKLETGKREERHDGGVVKILSFGRETPPGNGRQGIDSLEALYRAVAGRNFEGPENRALSLKEGARGGVNAPDTRPVSEGARGDLAASKGATSPASSLSSQSGSLKSGSRSRIRRTESACVEKRGPPKRLESLTWQAMIGRGPSDWLETDAETDMEEIRRNMQRKEMQELAELEEFEEIEKTVMKL